MSKELDQQAVDILKMNDRGGYTVPTAHLYPYQWNWDSAFVALGFATFDRKRAWKELDLLLEGQWPNGMVAHVIFRRNDPYYFPGPSVWKANEALLPTTGLSNPPVFTSVVRTLVENGGELDEQNAKQMFEPLMRWHRWFHKERTPEGCPVVASVHPWEGGRDNCPDREIGLERMDVDPDLEPFERMDTKHANPSQRPSKEQYDKYVSIIKYGSDHDWDQVQLTNHGPFLMADPGIHFILLRADRDLLALAKRFDYVESYSEIEQWIEKGVSGSDYLWNPDISAFCARDVRTGLFSQGFSNASALCFYADAGTKEQRAHTMDHLKRIQKKVKYMLPTWDPDSPEFEPQRYWCGPVWPQMNHMISNGLAEQGEQVMADVIRDDFAKLVMHGGFGECFDPLSGDGCIGINFSWTASLWLA
jgi:hypothetical protein